MLVLLMEESSLSLAGDEVKHAAECELVHSLLPPSADRATFQNSRGKPMLCGVWLTALSVNKIDSLGSAKHRCVSEEKQKMHEAFTWMATHSTYRVLK